jgi:hypothetical protein
MPGSVLHPKGSHKYAQAKNQDELDNYLADGWFLTIEEAANAMEQIDLTPHRRGRKVILKREKEPVETEKSDDDILPPTRLEMEIKAALLGVKYDGRTSDKKLLERIEEALQ